jgi:carboxyl-terminal processing protease
MVAAVVVWMAGAGFQRANSANTNENLYEGLKLFSDVIELIQREYVDEVDAKDLIQKAIQGMVQSLDPHSSLMPPDAYEDLQIDTKGKFTGIGIHITMRDGFVTVISPIEDTPAYKAGIEAGDRIIKVDGQLAKDLREAVRMMRGPRGSKVTVTIMRNGIKKPLEFELTRDEIPILSVKSISKPGYGYVRTLQLHGHDHQEFESSESRIEPPREGAGADLRNNGWVVQPGHQLFLIFSPTWSNLSISAIRKTPRSSTPPSAAQRTIDQTDQRDRQRLNGWRAQTKTAQVRHFLLAGRQMVKPDTVSLLTYRGHYTSPAVAPSRPRPSLTCAKFLRTEARIRRKGRDELPQRI